MYYSRDMYMVYTHNNTGNVFRLTIKASCPMYLQYFPVDEQMCPLEIGSCKLTCICLKLQSVYVVYS